jgi:FkbM family methyltransferase
MRSKRRSPPMWFSFVHNLPYGRYRVMDYLKKTGWIDDRIVELPFHDRMIQLPMNIVDGDLSRYQHERIFIFSQICNTHLSNFDFFDCGAHLGLFSAQFTRFSDRVETLIAIEPNPVFFNLLQSNLQNITAKRVECVNAALSNFVGTGRLVEANYDSSMDAMYLVNDPGGDIQVTTLAAMLQRRTQSRVAIKVDVEGLEVPVLSGAADAIRSLDRIVLFIEIHKTVLERIGMSDVEMLAEIETIRPLSWVNSDDRAHVDPKRSILDQLKRETQCDLIGVG